MPLSPNRYSTASSIARITFTWTESRTDQTGAPVRRRTSRERVKRSTQGVRYSRLPRAVARAQRPGPPSPLLLTEVPETQRRSKQCAQRRSRPRQRRGKREADGSGVARQNVPRKRPGGHCHRAWTPLSRPSGRSDRTAHRQGSTGARGCDGVERMAGAQWWIT